MDLLLLTKQRLAVMENYSESDQEACIKLLMRGKYLYDAKDQLVKILRLVRRDRK